MKFKKVLLTALCCAMATAAFAACEKDEESSKNPSTQQNPSIQTPNTQTPTTPVTPVVKTVTAEQWSQIFTAMPTVNNVTVSFSYEGKESTQSGIFQLADGRIYHKYNFIGMESEQYFAQIEGKEYKWDKNNEGKWEKEECDENYTYTLSDLQLPFSNYALTFDLMQFDQTTGVYYMIDTEESGEEFRVSFGFANGRLISISVQSGEAAETYTFSNYGVTQITLPDEGGNNPGGPTDGGEENLPPISGEWSEEDWQLALSNLLNTMTGEMEIYDYVYENGRLVDYEYTVKAVENGTKAYEYSFWEDEDSSSSRDRYYEHINGMDYVYECTDDTWGKYENYVNRCNFTDFGRDWYYDAIVQSIPYLKYDGKVYSAEDFYYEDGESVTYDSIQMEVANAKIKSIEIICHNPDWSEELYIEMSYDDVIVELPYVDDGGNEEEGGEDGGDVVYSGTYDFYVVDQNGNALPGYKVQLSTNEVCFLPIEVDNSGWAYVDLTSYGCEEGAYNITIYDANNNPVKFDGAYQTWGYGEYELVVYVEESAEGEDSSTPDEDMSGVWNEAFKNTLSATDFTAETTMYNATQEAYATYQLDNGCRVYHSQTFYTYETDTNECFDVYYERVGSYDYVYEYDYNTYQYTCYETTADDEVYSMSEFEGLLSMMEGLYSVMTYQGDGIFVMDKDYMNDSFKVFDEMTQIEVVLMDGYVNAIRFYGYDTDGNSNYLAYEFYNFNSTDVYMPEVSESGEETPESGFVTNY